MVSTKIAMAGFLLVLVLFLVLVGLLVYFMSRSSPQVQEPEISKPGMTHGNPYSSSSVESERGTSKVRIVAVVFLVLAVLTCLVVLVVGGIAIWLLKPVPQPPRPPIPAERPNDGPPRLPIDGAQK